MKSIVVPVLAAILAAGCANSTPARAEDPAPPISDASLGLVPGGVFDTPTPPALRTNERAPGEAPVLPRPYAGAPPRVPHTVSPFLPITLKQNACLDCHALEEAAKGEPTPIPPTHYTDSRNAPGRVGSAVVGARYVCVSCHVPSTDAPDLVENRFRR